LNALVALGHKASWPSLAAGKIMYRDYFGFKESPFSIAPDPRFLYMSERHREALAHLLYGMQTDGGFVLVSGEVGTGKTTMCRCLLDQLPENVDVAFILNPRVTTSELLASICDEFAINYPPGNRSIKLFVDRINTFLLETHAKGRRAVVIIDEAQNLHPTVLEQVRLLTNLETSEHKLLQVIMLGQPEILKILDRPELRQLAQRITARYHLEALSRQELGGYINHRLAVAGLRHELFTPGIVRSLYRLSGGIPRLTNVICDRALLGAYVQGHTRVKRRTLAKAAREVLGQRSADTRPRPATPWWVTASVAVLVGVFVFGMDFFQHRAVPVETPTEVMPPASVTENFAPAPEAVTENVAPAPEAITASGVPASGMAPAVALPAAALAWPADLPVSMSKAMAFRALLARWGRDFALAEHDDVCQYARRYGLECLFRRGNLDSLQQFNGPAVLRLSDDQGQDFYAALVELRGEAATLVVGQAGRVVSLADLQAHWPGEFTMLWRPPPGYHVELTEGGQGDAVKWLRERLAVVQGRQVQGEGNRNLVFDAGLKRQVEVFQTDQGLKADGIAGPQTLMRLNTFSEPGAPVLLAPGREE